jgi:hypothetical protein
MPRLRGHAELREALGSEVLMHFSVAARAAVTEEVRELAEDVGNDRAMKQLAWEERATLVGRFSRATRIREGDTIGVAVEESALHFFDPSTGAAIYDDAADRVALVVGLSDELVDEVDEVVIARDLRDGETRTRTGDTTIFILRRDPVTFGRFGAHLGLCGGVEVPASRGRTAATGKGRSVVCATLGSQTGYECRARSRVEGPRVRYCFAWRLSHKPPTDPVRRSVMGRPILRGG